MWIKRDLSKILEQKPSLPVQIVWGPRQCGKTSMLRQLSSSWTFVTLDDLRQRKLAHTEPELFLKQHPQPLLIDEAQYAPHLFSQLKIEVDEKRFQSSVREASFRLTGSHQILLDDRIKESLGGRASFFRLHGFSLAELGPLAPSVEEFIFRGAWPELNASPGLNPVDYLNDYIRTVVEKDVALALGIKDLSKFQICLGLLAARVGEILNFDSLGREAGITGVTLRNWILQLERSGLAGLLRPFHSNLNKRLIKSPKFYFLDTGLAARLQGFTDTNSLFRSFEFGHLFENLVLTEIIKTRDHHRKSWEIFFWRTKDGEEYDFVIRSQKSCVVIDAQVSIQSPKPIQLSQRIQKDLGATSSVQSCVCTFAGLREELTKTCDRVSVAELSSYLLEKL